MDNSNIWNKKKLEPPPIASYKTKSLSLDLTTLQNVLEESINTLKNQTLNKEAAFLSRFIYCLKTKLRHNKAIKSLQKISQALLRYLRIDVVRHFQVFKDMLPNNTTGVIYLPTRSMLHYLLVRLQGVAQLMVRVVETSKIAGFLLNQHIHIGHLWKMLFIGFGMVSRIYVLSKELLKSCCNLYTQLLPFANSLEDLNYHWLPTAYVLPNDLKQWLNTKCLDKEMIQDSQINETSSYLLGLSNLEDNDEWFEQITNVKVIDKSSYMQPAEDLGVPVERLNLPKKKKKSELNKSKDNDHINSLKDLKKFQINFKQNPEKYTDNFKKIDRMQCNMLQKLLSKYVRRMEKCVNDSEKASNYLNQVKDVLQNVYCIK